MSRVPNLDPDEMAPDQKRLYDEIAGPRGGVGGPFALWIRLPKIADVANKFGNAIRLEGALDRRIFELVILHIARYWGAQYEWFVHEPAAVKAGLSQTIIDAIRNGEAVTYDHDADAVASALTLELLKTRTVSQATYDRTLDQFGIDLFIELVTVIGFYTTAAMMINTFDAPVPGDARPLPDLPG